MTQSYIIVLENDIIFDKINVYNLYWLFMSLIKYYHSNKLQISSEPSSCKDMFGFILI